MEVRETVASPETDSDRFQMSQHKTKAIGQQSEGLARAGTGKASRQMVLVAIIGVLFFTTVYGQPRGQRTAGMINGRAWVIFTPKMRTSFLAGFGDGIGVYSCGSDQFKSVKKSSLSIGESKKMLDDFYSNPENILIPVAAALELVTDRGGESPDEYGSLLLEARRIASRSDD